MTPERTHCEREIDKLKIFNYLLEKFALLIKCPKQSINQLKLTIRNEFNYLLYKRKKYYDDMLVIKYYDRSLNYYLIIIFNIYLIILLFYLII